PLFAAGRVRNGNSHRDALLQCLRLITTDYWTITGAAIDAKPKKWTCGLEPRLLESGHDARLRTVLSRCGGQRGLRGAVDAADPARAVLRQSALQRSTTRHAADFSYLARPALAVTRRHGRDRQRPAQDGTRARVSIDTGGRGVPRCHRAARRLGPALDPR